MRRRERLAAGFNAARSSLLAFGAAAPAWGGGVRGSGARSPRRRLKMRGRRDSGAPPGGRREFDPALLEAFPGPSHVRLASPRTGPSAPMLRRRYGFDGGLLFLASCAIPRGSSCNAGLAERDPLSGYARDTSSAVFAILPGARPGGFVGDRLVG